MTTTPADLRDAGMATAEDHSDPRLILMIDALIAEHIATGEPFSANDIRDRVPGSRSGIGRRTGEVGVDAQGLRHEVCGLDALVVAVDPCKTDRGVGRGAVLSALIEQEIELIALPPGTVIMGPEWNEECYQRGGDTDQWWTPASDVPWTSRSLLPRGPFRVLHMGSPT